MKISFLSAGTLGGDRPTATAVFRRSRKFLIATKTRPRRGPLSLTDARRYRRYHADRARHRWDIQHWSNWSEWRQRRGSPPSWRGPCWNGTVTHDQGGVSHSLSRRRCNKAYLHSPRPNSLADK